MLSAKESLSGNTLSVNALIDNLFETIIKKPINTDLSQQRLQIHFVDRIRLLLEDEKLNPAIKSVLLETKHKIHKFAKRKSGAHYKYLKIISE